VDRSLERSEGEIMQLKSYTDGREWLRASKIDIPVDDLIDDNNILTLKYRIPNDSGHKTAIARMICNEFLAVDSVVFLIQEHGIWASNENEFMFVKFRELVLGREVEGIDEMPFHIFSIHENDDFRVLECFFAISLYFYWGVLVFSCNDKFTITTSHDEILFFQSSLQVDIDRFSDCMKAFCIEPF
jgi:hypothetical protein